MKEMFKFQLHITYSCMGKLQLEEQHTINAVYNLTRTAASQHHVLLSCFWSKLEAVQVENPKIIHKAVVRKV